eukprot:228664-Rhodomonas_salina.5
MALKSGICPPRNSPEVGVHIADQDDTTCPRVFNIVPCGIHVTNRRTLNQVTCKSAGSFEINIGGMLEPVGVPVVHQLVHRFEGIAHPPSNPTLC